jgi:hypothetical protein
MQQEIERSLRDGQRVRFLVRAGTLLLDAEIDRSVGVELELVTVPGEGFDINDLPARSCGPQ